MFAVINFSDALLAAHRDNIIRFSHALFQVRLAENPHLEAQFCALPAAVQSAVWSRTLELLADGKNI